MYDIYTKGLSLKQMMQVLKQHVLMRSLTFGSIFKSNLNCLFSRCLFI